MLSIYSKKNTVQNCKNHYDFLKDALENKINKSKTISKADKSLLISDLKTILTSRDFKKLHRLNNKYLKKYPFVIVNSKKVTSLSKIFDYKSFRKSYGYNLSNQIDVKCCPYCNRNYTTSHTTLIEEGKDKLVFPEYDHFYPKSLYPILAISFYNLIPSCNICNTHYKMSKDPKKEKIFNPYTEVDENHFRFKIVPKNYEALVGKTTNIDLDFEFNSSPEINLQLKKSIDFFGIKDAYEKNHINLIKNIIDKKVSFSDSYMKQLHITYGLNFEERYKIVFETYYEEENLNKRPFSKLKKDIHDYFEKIKK